MDSQSFVASTSAAQSPDGLSLAMEGVVVDAKEDWEYAHVCAQERDDVLGMRAHT